MELPTAGATAGQIQLFFKGLTGSATTDVLVDVVGYYTAPRRSGISQWDTIPSGQTVTGEIIYDESAANASSDYIPVNLPARASIDLTSETVDFAPDATVDTLDDNAACTGTYVEPTAPAGRVCLYFGSAEGIESISGESNFSLRDAGLFVYVVTPTVSTDTYLYATWAYTAP